MPSRGRDCRWPISNTLAATWESRYRTYIERQPRCVTGERAVYALAQRLPANLVILSGIKVPQHANLGGNGRAAFRAEALRRVDRDLANTLELIVSAADFSWSCVFTHEGGGGYAYETLYDLS